MEQSRISRPHRRRTQPFPTGSTHSVSLGGEDHSELQGPAAAMPATTKSTSLADSTLQQQQDPTSHLHNPFSPSSSNAHSSLVDPPANNNNNHHQTPHTAPHPRRIARQYSLPFPNSYPFSESSPSLTAGTNMSLRKRSRAFDADGAGDEDDESHQKGSHNLRKRAKIDYSAEDFEDEVPEIALPAPRTSTRKRRAESETLGSEDLTPTAQRRRAASREPSIADSSSSAQRRRASAHKKLMDQLPSLPGSDDIKDTIEVVGDSNDLQNPGYQNVSDFATHYSLSALNGTTPQRDPSHYSSPLAERRGPVFQEQAPAVQPNSLGNSDTLKHAKLQRASSDSKGQAVASSASPEATRGERDPGMSKSTRQARRQSSRHQDAAAMNGLLSNHPATTKSQATKSISNGIEAEHPAQHPKVYPWSHLSPYVKDEYSLHPEPAILGAPGDEDAQDADGAGGGGEDADGIHASEEMEDVREDEPHADTQETGASTNLASGVPTPTSLTPRLGSPVQQSAAATGTNTPAISDKVKAASAKASQLRQRKQYKFPMPRDPEELQEFLKDHEKLSKSDLYALLAHANDFLKAWQDEWQMHGRKIDDYENAKRRAAQDAEYEKKTADLNQFSRFESYLEKDFELRGYRAPYKEKEGLYYLRWQDKVEASAYGFEYDAHVSKLGQQDPISQRKGIMAGRQLRSQPQQTAKAAEAGEGGDGLVMMGKRARNPPKLYDGLLQESDNRSSTPMDKGSKVLPKRRGRGAATQPDDTQPDSDTGSVVSKKPATRKRGPKPRRTAGMAELDFDADDGTPELEPNKQPTPTTNEPPKRRRGRQSKAALEAAAAAAAEAEAEAEANHTEPENGIEMDVDEPEVAHTPKRPQRARKRARDSAPLSVKLNKGRRGADAAQDARSSPPFSDGTVSDDETAYGLRQNKRQRNFKHEADVDRDAIAAMQPQKKRPRISIKNSHRPQPSDAEPKAKSQKPTVSSRILESLAEVSVPKDTPSVYGSRIITFKHHGNDRWSVSRDPEDSTREAAPVKKSPPKLTLSTRPSAIPSGPPSAAPSAASSAPASQASEDSKDYSNMTKSEKMSASMKKRWMNGSMQNAVNKRKATLAAKKAAAAAAAVTNPATPPPTTPASQSEARPQQQQQEQQQSTLPPYHMPPFMGGAPSYR